MKNEVSTYDLSKDFNVICLVNTPEEIANHIYTNHETKNDIPASTGDIIEFPIQMYENGESKKTIGSAPYYTAKVLNTKYHLYRKGYQKTIYCELTLDAINKLSKLLNISLSKSVKDVVLE